MVSARVTAAVYDSIAGGNTATEVSISGSNVDVSKTPTKTTFINSERHAAIDFQRHIGGYDYIAPFERWAGTSTDPERAARNVAQEVTIYSDPFNLGDGPAWQASTAYAYGRTVFPTTGGSKYYIATAFGPYYKTGTSGSTEPTWPTTDYATVVDNGITWVCLAANKVVLQMPVKMRFYPKRVGFIAERVSGTVQPSINFGEDNEGGEWLSTIQTTNLTEFYTSQVYDVRTTALGSFAMDAFRVVQGTGEYAGRFFWTGFIIEEV